MEYLVSIILPVYNAEEYVDECISNILVQTYRKFELIVINDGSTDNSMKIISSFKDERIKIIENNHNFIESLNLGIKAANGEFIARMDADDIMLPNRLETQVKFMDTHPQIDICGSWAETFYAKKYVMKMPVGHKAIVSSLLLNNILIHPTIIMRVSSISKFPEYPNLYKANYIYAEDYKLWTEMSEAGYRFANIPKVLLKYRLSQKQVTYTKRKEMFHISSQIRLEYASYIMKMISDKESEMQHLFFLLNNLIRTEKIKLDSLPSIIYSICVNYI